jgi:hypothetical protein
VVDEGLLGVGRALNESGGHGTWLPSPTNQLFYSMDGDAGLVSSFMLIGISLWPASGRACV